MGIGDDIIATSMARGSADRGELAAFGDGTRIIWGPHSEMVFKNNPNIAKPGQERLANLKWHHYYKGHRIYNKAGVGRWLWNYDFSVSPGELFLSNLHPRDDKLIIVEPNLPNKPCSPNKDWSVSKWAKLTEELIHRGWRVRQFDYGGPHRVAPWLSTPSFRHAADFLKSARLAILPEGGLHHAAAAVGTPAIVLFGGFVPPRVLGYDSHANLTGGAEACGSFRSCSHCAGAMAKITVDQVLHEVEKVLGGQI